MYLLILFLMLAVIVFGIYMILKVQYYKNQIIKKDKRIEYLNQRIHAIISRQRLNKHIHR